MKPDSIFNGFGRSKRGVEQGQYTHTPQYARHKFDKTSGLQYTETSVDLQTENDQDWLYRTDISGKTAEEASNKYFLCCNYPLNGLPGYGMARATAQRGPRSLHDTVIEYLVENISQVRLDSIGFLPVPLVEKLWNVLHQRALVSFHVFCMFSKILGVGGSNLDLLRYRAQISAPISPLHVYIAPLSSKTFDFLTILSITKHIDVVDSVNLSSIPNLIALEIVAPLRCVETGVSDRVVRAWSEAAKSDGAFSILRILKLWNHEDITTESLRFVNYFPALAVYDLQGCTVRIYSEHNAHGLGWTAQLSTNILELLETVCEERVKIMQGNTVGKPNTMQRLDTNPLSDRTGVKWISRHKIPDLLTRASTESKAPSEIVELQTGPQRPLQRSSTLQPTDSFEHWDSVLYSSLSRIGELRNDRDLRAKINIDKQAVVGRNLIISHPTISFRLGDTLSFLGPLGIAPDESMGFLNPPTTRISRVVQPGGVTFLRTALPKSVRLCDGDSGGSQMKRGKTSIASVPKNKRRKIDDVLKSFF